MSVSSISQSNVLGADVLLMIFQQVEGEDLLNCEAVCRQWRDILLAGTPWRQLFHRKVNYSPSWRKEQKKLEKNQLRTEQYRDVCKKILQVSRNWSMRRFKKSVYSLNKCIGSPDSASYIGISDDYVAWDNHYDEDPYYDGCAFLDTESMEIKEIPSPNYLYRLNEMAVMIDHASGKLEVADPDNRWVVNVLNEEAGETGDDLDERSFLYGSNVLVEQRSEGGSERIRIWKMGHPPILLQDFTSEFPDCCTFKVDEQFIVIGQCYRWWESETLYFYSTETLEVFTSLSAKKYRRAYDRGMLFQSRVNGIVRTPDVAAGSFNQQNCKWQYDRGLLFQSRGNGIVRILDVASGTHFNDVRMPFRKEDGGSVQLLDLWAASNSKFVVIGWKHSEKSSTELFHFSVYDLDAIKNPNSSSDCHLLYTLKFRVDVEQFVINENVIAFSGEHRNGKRYMTILNFANVRRSRKIVLPEQGRNGTLKKSRIFV